MASISCDASFRLITAETDSLMTPYGIATSVDTADVCESWTGSDYAYQATRVGSSDDIPGYADTIRTVVYTNGTATGYDANGGVASNSVSTQGNAFDFLYADNATRQASYDYPYYGVASPAPGGCTSPPCPVVSLNIPVPASGNTGEYYGTRHGCRHGEVYPAPTDPFGRPRAAGRCRRTRPNT